MADPLFVVSDKGIRVASLAEAKDRYDEENKRVFGEDLNLNAHTPQNQIAGINALIWAEVGEQILRTALYGASISHAEGIFLDSFGSLLDIRRRKASATRVIGTLKGDNGAFVPAGSLVRSTSNHLFRSEEDAVLSEDGVDVVFVAEEKGDIVVHAGELNQIVSSANPSWQSVHNENPGITGLSEESDTEYRQNLLQLTSYSAVGTLDAIHDSLIHSGAEKVNVIENSSNAIQSVSNVLLPPRSLLIVAVGGLDSDLARSYQIRRPIGVSTEVVRVVQKDLVLDDVKKIRNGYIKYNDNVISNIDLRNVSTIDDVVDYLNNKSNLPPLRKNGVRPYIHFNWHPELNGFEEVESNYTEANRQEELVFDTIYGTGRHIVITTSKEVSGVRNATGNTGNTLPYVQYTTAQNSTPTEIGASLNYDLNRIFILLSEQPPSDLEDLIVSLDIEDKETSTFVNFANQPVDYYQSAQINDDLNKSTFRAYSHATTNGVHIVANMLKSAGEWKYRRYDGVEWLDKDANDQPIYKSFTTAALGSSLSESLSGFTPNRSGAFVDIANSLVTKRLFFIADNEPPQVESVGKIDGRVIHLTFDRQLEPSDKSYSTMPWWNIRTGGSANAVRRQKITKNVVQLYLSRTITQNTSVSLNYISSNAGTNGVMSDTKVRASNFSVALFDNKTITNYPASPYALHVFQEPNNTIVAKWRKNDDGGTAIDSYEYSYQYENERIWTDWESTGSTETSLRIYPDTKGRLPQTVRVRASNPNTRTLLLLGINGMESLTPITRPIDKKLKVEITLANTDKLVGDVLQEIRDAVVNKVLSYDLGEEIWTNDILAVVESITNVRVNSIRVTNDGTSVNQVKQPAYTHWIISPTDVVFT